jgi:biopolymer transport protein ExbD
VGAQLGSAKGGFADLNLTPLIDIVLVVLIIMMVNIPLQMETMGLKLPAQIDNPPPPPVDPPKQLVIALYEDGTMALNRMLMGETILFDRMSRELRNMEPKNVFIDAHPKTPFGRVVDMMDIAREGGAAKVGLTKMKLEGPQIALAIAPNTLPRGMGVGSPKVVGTLSHTDADAALQPHRGVLEQCYLSRVPVHGSLNGRVLVKVDVGPQGEVMSHRIHSSNLEGPGKEEIEACIDQVLGTLRFQPLGPGKTAYVMVPLMFSPG